MKFRTRLSITICAVLLIAPLNGMNTDTAAPENKGVMSTVAAEVANLSVVAIRHGISAICLRPVAAPMGTLIHQNIQDPIVAYGTTALCYMQLSRVMNAGLNFVSFIPKAPRAPDWTHYFAHMLVSTVSSHAVNSVMSNVSHNLNRNYAKKNGIIPTATKTMCVTNESYFKDKDLTLDLNQGNPAFTYHHTRTIDRDAKPQETKYICTVSQDKSRVIIDEALMLKDLNIVVTARTEYETRETYWNFKLPWGIHRFRPALQALKEKVMSHHITLTHVLLKNIF
jgi:hypothetical protein